MAGPQYSDEVQVVLNTVNQSSRAESFDRCILLSKKNPKLVVGRSSKRDARFSPGEKNGWFDSAVMSRSHAKVTYLPDSNALTIMDTESLHGTFVNNKRISNLQGHPLHQNDIVRFGVPIQKGSEVFPACEVEVKFKYGSISPEKRPAVFKVPDSTDGEDEASDIDATIEASVALIQKAGMSSSPMSHRDSVGAIDLTADDDFEEDAGAAPNGSPRPHEVIIDETGSQAAESAEDSLRWMSEDVDNLYDESEVIANPTKSAFSPVIETDDDDLFNIMQDGEGVVAETPFDKSRVNSLENAATPTLSHSQGPATQTPAVEQDVVPNALYVSSSCDLTDCARSSIEHSDINDDISVEDLGTKSGKSEFFAAREHNRRICHSYDEGDKETNRSGNVHSAVGNDGTSGLESSSILSSRLPRNCTTDSASSLLITPGKELLHGRTALISPEQDESRDDFYNDDLVYTFESSQRAANATGLVKAQATPQLDSQVEELGEFLTPTSAPLDFPATVISPQSFDDACAKDPSTGKRKADEISQLVPGEEDSSQRSAAHPDPIAGAVEAAFNNSSMTTESSEQPRFKRIRRVAEAVGYAALGGVAVMSALIATAPTL